MPTTTQSRVTLDPEVQFATQLHHLDRHRRALDARTGLGAADMRLLWLLADGQARSLRQVAEALHLEQSTVNRQVNAAVSEGYLRRFKASGRASYLFESTTHGREVFQSETSAALDLYKGVLVQMGPERSVPLLELFAEFVRLYGEAIQRSGTVPSRALTSGGGPAAI